MPSLNFKLISRLESDGRTSNVNGKLLFSYKLCFIVFMSNINLIFFPQAASIEVISTSASGQSCQIESGRVTTQCESFSTLLGVLLAVNSYLFFRNVDANPNYRYR